MGHKTLAVNRAARVWRSCGPTFPPSREIAKVREDSRTARPLTPGTNIGMALDSYSSCPCGSGKKFKWCCQPIHVDIDRAYRQDAEGQHEAALKIMDQLVAAHPANPEAWGRRAHLLYQNGQVEEAEK